MKKELKSSNILIVLDSFLFGGAERQAVCLAHFIKIEIGAAIKIVVLNGKSSGTLGEHLAEYHIDHYDLEFRFSSSHFSRILDLLSLSWKIRKHKPDIIIPFTLRPNVNVNAIWQLTGAKLCLWNQRDLGHGFSYNKRDKIFLWSLNNTRAFVSNSKEGIDLLNKFSQTKRRRRKVIYNGLDYKHGRVEGGKTINAGNRIVVTMVANLTRYKDHKTLLEVWKKILDDWLFEEKPLLVLVGAKAETYGSLLKYVLNNNLEMTVMFTGGIKDVNEILYESDIGVLSSKKEGMSNSILEYMLSGLPVLASDIEGNRECLGQDYEFLYNVNGADDLKKKLLVLLRMSKSERTDLGSLNQSRAKESFSIQKMGNNYIEFINSLD